MASPLRLKRVAALLQEEVGGLIARDIVLPKHALVTVVDVTISPDLLYAAVRISVYPTDTASAAFSILEKNIWRLQQSLNKRLRMRPVPKLRFITEDSSGAVIRVEELLKSLNTD